MDIEDIVSKEYRVFSPDARVSEINGFFKETNNKAAIIQDSEYEGMVTQRQLISSHHKPGEKASNLMRSPPYVENKEDIREVARLMVENNAKVLPVMRGERLDGIVAVDDLLKRVTSNLGVLKVEDVYTQEVISIEPDASVGKAINKLRENGVSRLPVIEDNALLGIVSIYDILQFTVREETKEKGGGGSGGEHGGFGSRGGDATRMLDIPVRDIMSSPVETTTIEESLDDATKKMLDNDYSALVVTNGSSPTGVITKTDVLRSLTWTEEGRMDVQISNVDLLDMISRDNVVVMIQDIADKYSDLQVLHANVHLQKHKENLRGNPLIHVRMILFTNKGQFVGTGEGFGARHALKITGDKLERQVLSKKSVRRSDRDAQRLIKELGLTKSN